jgi:hypothetical protein
MMHFNLSISENLMLVEYFNFLPNSFFRNFIRSGRYLLVTLRCMQRRVCSHVQCLLTVSDLNENQNMSTILA